MNSEYRKLTVKMNKGKPLDVQQHHYMTWLQRAADKGIDVVCYAFERDKSQRLHMHGYLYVTSNFYIKSLVLPGWHVRVDKLPQTVFDLQGYMTYICKCQGYREKALIQKQFNDHVREREEAFTDPLYVETDRCLFDL